MFLEVYKRQKLMVQTECHLAGCSRTLRLRSEASDGRLLISAVRIFEISNRIVTYYSIRTTIRNFRILIQP